MGIAEGTAALVAAGLALWLGTSAPAQAMVAQAYIFLLAAAIAWQIEEPATPIRPPESRTTFAQLVVGRLKDFWSTVSDELRHNSPGRWLILYSAVIGCTTMTVVYLVQPYLHELQLPLWLFAVAWAPYHFAWAGFALLSGRYLRRLGRTVALGSLVLIAAAANVAMALLPGGVGVLTLFAFYFVRGVQMPAVVAWLGSIVRRDRPATMLSVRSTLQWSMFVVMNLILGYTTELYGTGAAFLVSAIVYAGLGALFLGLLAKVQWKQV
jgi:hypothetical protein